jgi:3-phosphoshikimate 1-carboxyvinyltransferase
MATTLRVSTAAGPVDAVVTVPGSKSIANRALVCAALATGESVVRNVPDGDDTTAMVRALGQLGVALDTERDTVTVRGSGGRLVKPAGALDAGLAGTTSRFVTALAALVAGPVTVTGAEPLRRRPMHPLHDALRQLGAEVEAVAAPGHLPVTVRGPLAAGGRVSIRGDVSSQYLTALMLIAPTLSNGLELVLTTPLVSASYVRLTATVMAAFGVGGVDIGPERIVVGPGTYRAAPFDVEPDASSASYPLAIAAVAGGRVVVRGLRTESAQGDVVFCDLLARMGAAPVGGGDIGIERQTSIPLRGIDADLADVSDLVPTLAAVAATASTPSRITGVGFIRAKESDRLGDLAEELGALGARVHVEPDGLRIEPAALHGGIVETHHDHRLAMAFGVIGAVVPGVRVVDPDVVSKSWPAFWTERDAVIATSRRPGTPRPVVVAFDVDGTLTTSDCVVPFLRLVGGTPRLVAGVARRGLGALAALARRDRDALKAIATRAAFAGRAAAQVDGLGRTFAGQVAANGLREDTLARLRWHQRQGHEIVLVSASFGAYLRPLADRLGAEHAPIHVLGTELEIADGRCTGELLDGNCRGPAKRRRLHEWLERTHGGRRAVTLWAYGDSAGDRELLADADHAVWAGDRLRPEPDREAQR